MTSPVLLASLRSIFLRSACTCYNHGSLVHVITSRPYLPVSALKYVDLCWIILIQSDTDCSAVVPWRTIFEILISSDVMARFYTFISEENRNYLFPRLFPMNLNETSHFVWLLLRYLWIFSI